MEQSGNVATYVFLYLSPTISTCGGVGGGVYIDIHPPTTARRVVGICGWLQNNPCYVLMCMYNYINDSTNKEIQQHDKTNPKNRPQAQTGKPHAAQPDAD